MPLTPSDIIKHYPIDSSTLERVAHRNHPLPITIVEPNPAWPTTFQTIHSRIESALGTTALSISHVGSTSIPTLPAKNVIDIDLTVANVHNEASYVPQLEGVGFRFLFREPSWHQHRFFVEEADGRDGIPVNLHVFGPECPEVEKHRIFRDWLRKTPADLELYANTKRECAEFCRKTGESAETYNARKEGVIKEILGRAFRDLGYVQ